MHKFFLLFSAIALTVPLYAQPAVQNTEEKRVPVSVENATVDDALLQAAKAGDFNFIADVTDVKERPEVSLLGQRSNTGMAMDISNQQGLAWQRSETGVYLFWKKPRLSAIAALIKQGQDLPKPKADPNFVKEFQDKLLAFMEKMRAEKLAQGAMFPLTYAIPVRDLPQDLRTSLVTYAQSLTDSRVQRRILQQRLFLLDKVAWQNAEMQARIYTFPDSQGNEKSDLVLDIRVKMPDGSNFGTGHLLEHLK